MRRIVYDDIKVYSFTLQRKQLLLMLKNKKTLDQCKFLSSQMKSGTAGEIVWSYEKKYSHWKKITKAEMIELSEPAFPVLFLNKSWFVKPLHRAPMSLGDRLSALEFFILFR